MERIWSESEVHELIRQWRTLPELWDIENACYRDKAKKREACQFLAELFDTTEREVFKKMYEMRAQFIENRSDWTLRRVYSAASPPPTWEYYEEMKFVYNNGRKQPQRSIDDLLPISQPTTEVSRKRKRPIPTKKSSSLPKKKTSNKKTASVQRTPNQPMDASQVFGNFVVTELKNLKNRENRKRLKRIIQRAIQKYTDLDKAAEGNEEEALPETQRYVPVEEHDLVDFAMD